LTVEGEANQSKPTKTNMNTANMETKEMQTEIEILENRETPSVLWG